MGKALQGEHYCLKHQGNHSHYAEHNCTVCKLVTDIDTVESNYKRAVRMYAKLKAELAELREAAKNRLKHGHHILCMSGVRPTKGVLADIEPPEKYACDCGHDKLAALLQERLE